MQPNIDEVVVRRVLTANGEPVAEQSAAASEAASTPAASGAANINNKK
jgi:hypothetical protein